MLVLDLDETLLRSSCTDDENAVPPQRHSPAAFAAYGGADEDDVVVQASPDSIDSAGAGCRTDGVIRATAIPGEAAPHNGRQMDIEFVDAPFLRDFCRVVTTGYGHALRVASFCNSDDRSPVVGLLDRCLPHDRLYLVDPDLHFACWSKDTKSRAVGAAAVSSGVDMLSTPADHDGHTSASSSTRDTNASTDATPTRGKNGHLRELRKVTRDTGEGDYQPYQIILIDDTLENVEAAQREGFNAFHCPDGFSEAWFATQTKLAHLLFGGSAIPTSLLPHHKN